MRALPGDPPAGVLFADFGTAGRRRVGSQPWGAAVEGSSALALWSVPTSTPTHPRPWGRIEAVLPPLSTAAARELEGSIEAHGVRVPVLVLTDGRIIDGHNRWRLSGGTAPIEVADGLDEDQAFVLGLALNLHRRHLSADQLQDVHENLRRERKARRELALRLRDEGATQAKAAALVGVAQQTVALWEAEREQRWAAERAEAARPAMAADPTSPPVGSITRSGSASNELSYTRGEAEARPRPRDAASPAKKRNDARVKVSAEERGEIVARVRAGENQNQVAADYGVTRRRVDQLLAQEAKQTAQHREVHAAAFDGGRYPVLLADPPWRYSQVVPSRAVERHYPTMALDDIKALGARADWPAADDAVLLLWATSPKLGEALEVLAAWGFEYVTCAVWVKDKVGLGYHFRQRHELLLVGRRGQLAAPEPWARPDSVIDAPRGEHSAKPELVYGLIERMYPDLPKVELFARGDRPGWAAWGHRVQEVPA